jgi:hypothetical protein
MQKVLSMNMNWRFGRRPRLSLFRIFLAALICLFYVSPAMGQSILRDVREAKKGKPLPLVLPYAFYSKTYDLALGVGAGITGYPQEQSRLYGTLLGSSNSTFLLGLGGSGLQVPGLDRVFLDPLLIANRYTEYRAYVNSGGNFAGEQAGSNDSSADNFFEGEGSYLRMELEFRYLLPIGRGKDEVIHTFYLDRGILNSGATGGDAWNPLVSGRTFLCLKPFYRRQTLKLPAADETFNTNGLELSLKYDNTDFSPNPSKGSFQRLAVSRDFGWANSSGSWAVVEAEFGKYFSLGASDTFRQRVIAFEFWTVDTPSAKSEGDHVSNQPPFYMGATLGGFYRMRAYPQYRFHDRSAVYYSAEARFTPYWNPIGEFEPLKPLQFDWMQFVGFAEVGRVAPSWSVGNLHSNMKWDVGVGFRAMLRKFVGRIDVAYGEEGGSTWVMVGHPF